MGRTNTRSLSGSCCLLPIWAPFKFFVAGRNSRLMGQRLTNIYPIFGFDPELASDRGKPPLFMGIKDIRKTLDYLRRCGHTELDEAVDLACRRRIIEPDLLRIVFVFRVVLERYECLAQSFEPLSWHSRSRQNRSCNLLQSKVEFDNSAVSLVFDEVHRQRDVRQIRRLSQCVLQDKSDLGIFDVVRSARFDLRP